MYVVCHGLVANIRRLRAQESGARSDVIVRHRHNLKTVTNLLTRVHPLANRFGSFLPCRDLSMLAHTYIGVNSRKHILDAPALSAHLKQLTACSQAVQAQPLFVLWRS